MLKPPDINVNDLYEIRRHLKKVDSIISIMIAQKRGKYLEVFGDMREMDKAQFIINKLCEFYGITYNNLVNYTRNQEVVKKRRFAIKAIRDYTALETTKIAYMLKYKNHATVLHHYRIADDELSDRVYGVPAKVEEYDKLLKYIGIK